MNAVTVQVRPQWPFKTRPCGTLDRGFVVVGWIKSLRESQVEQQELLRAYQQELLRAYREKLKEITPPPWPAHAIGGLPAELPHPVFAIEQTRTIEHLFARRGVEVTIAHNPDDPTHFYGFVAAEPGTVHYVYVKGFYRRAGIASALLEPYRGPQLYHSHETGHPAARKLIRSLRSTHNPYRARSA